MKVNTTIEITGIHEVFDLTNVKGITSGGIIRAEVAATNCGYFLIDEFHLDEKKGVYNCGRHVFEGTDFLFTTDNSMDEAIKIGYAMIKKEVSFLKDKIKFLESKDLRKLWDYENAKVCCSGKCLEEASEEEEEEVEDQKPIDNKSLRGGNPVSFKKLGY